MGHRSRWLHILQEVGGSAYLARGRWICMVVRWFRPSKAVASTVAALRETRCKDRTPRGRQYQPSRPPALDPNYL
jgi:hypothetical protein